LILLCVLDRKLTKAHESRGNDKSPAIVRAHSLPHAGSASECWPHKSRVFLAAAVVINLSNFGVLPACPGTCPSTQEAPYVLKVFTLLTRSRMKITRKTSVDVGREIAWQEAIVRPIARLVRHKVRSNL